MVRLEGYAIVSIDGMIADRDGRMTETLTIEADQVFYRTSLARAQLIVHGRNSSEGGAEAEARRRLVVTSRVDALSPSESNPRAVLWNPLGVRFADVLQALNIEGGVVAIVGGTDVFELFLNIGYDTFYLSRSTRGRLPGGRPMLRGVPDQSPEDLLREAGLQLCGQQRLGSDLTLSIWQRPPAGSIDPLNSAADIDRSPRLRHRRRAATLR
jgi:dihydrofolate reductase